MNECPASILPHDVLPNMLVRVDNTFVPQAQAAASTAFKSIIERQGLVERAQQEMQLAARYKSVLGLTSSMQAHCRSRHFNQILPSYQQATALIQAQAAAAPARAAKWGTLQHIMDQVCCSACRFACVTGHGSHGMHEICFYCNLLWLPVGNDRE